MKLVVAKGSLSRFLRGSQRVLLAVGVSLLGYCAFVLADAWIFQERESRNFERQLYGEGADHGIPEAASLASLKDSPEVLAKGLIGRIEIPRLDLSAVVMEGMGRTTLRRAVGHIPGTALPGQPGNVGISGHRDTFFRPLRHIRQGDLITLTTLLGEFRYRVVSTKIVAPTDIAVLDPGKDEILTLVTCYPFYFVGPAPDRFIVRAERIGDAT